MTRRAVAGICYDRRVVVWRVVLALLLLPACGRFGFGDRLGIGPAVDDGAMAVDGVTLDDAYTGGTGGDAAPKDAKLVDSSGATDTASSTTDAGARTVIIADWPTSPGAVLGATFDDQLDQANPTTNYGGRGYLDMTATSVAVIRFDLSSIAPGTTVLSAGFGLYVLKNADAGGTVNIYQCLESWDEGTGGNNGTVGTANWNDRMAGTAWTTAGAGVGSRGTTVLASSPLAMSGYSYGFGVNKAVVQGWIDNPASNHGFVFVATGYTINWPEIGAKDASQDFRRPSLQLQVTP